MTIKSKKFAELFLNQKITELNAKLEKETSDLIKYNLTRIRRGLTKDLDELKNRGDFNV